MCRLSVQVDALVPVSCKVAFVPIRGHVGTQRGVASIVSMRLECYAHLLADLRSAQASAQGRMVQACCRGRDSPALQTRCVQPSAPRLTRRAPTGSCVHQMLSLTWLDACLCSEAGAHKKPHSRQAVCSCCATRRRAAAVGCTHLVSVSCCHPRCLHKAAPVYLRAI